MVSSGREARRLFSASFISAAVPSKNLPHPVSLSASPRRKTPNSLGVSQGRAARTANEECVTSKDSLVATILGEVADAVLGVAGRVDTPNGDVAELEGLAVCWGLGDTLAVLASDDF